MNLYWLIQLSAWFIFTIAILLYNYSFGDALNFGDYLFAAVIFVIGIVGTHSIKIIAHQQKWFNNKIIKLFSKFALASFGLSVLGFFTLVLINYFINQSWNKSINFYTFISFTSGYGAAIFTWCLCYFMIHFFKYFKLEEIKNLRKEAEVKRLLYEQLKAQLNPHFMFNSMNVIRALIDENKDKAKIGISKLSNILRYTLNMQEKKVVPLKDELALVCDYIDLEILRFEARLKVEIDLPDVLLNYKIPPMLLQTLVENAIKHGVNQNIKGGIVKIWAKKEAQTLQIYISNPGRYFNHNKGTGIPNSLQRLENIYGNSASLIIHNQGEDEVVSILTLPI